MGEPMNPRGVIIAGAHTDIGKTYTACALIRAARHAGMAVDALKPVVSGFDETDWRGSDPARLLTALGREQTPLSLAAISPWRFKAPLAPPMAAAREGRGLTLADLAGFCKAGLADSRADLMVIEGVGGLMSPIAERATGLDLMKALGLPCLLVVGSYLGAISHGLTALETLRTHGLGVIAVVVSEDADEGAPDFADTVGAFRDFADATTILAAPRGTESPWSDELVDLLKRTSDGKREG